MGHKHIEDKEKFNEYTIIASETVACNNVQTPLVIMVNKVYD